MTEPEENKAAQLPPALPDGADDEAIEGLDATRGLDLAAVLGGVLGFVGEGESDNEADGLVAQTRALASGGLLNEIMELTGLNKATALSVIMAVLKALGVGKTTTAKKPKAKPKPKPAAKPKPKPASSAKPKPKPASSSAKPKPKAKAKPKTKPKAKAKPKSKRSTEA